MLYFSICPRTEGCDFGRIDRAELFSKIYVDQCNTHKPIKIWTEMARTVAAALPHNILVVSGGGSVIGVEEASSYRYECVDYRKTAYRNIILTIR